MSSFRHNFASDVLLSCEYIQILLMSNSGIETISYELSKMQFGKVSSIFKKIIENEEKGYPVRKSIKELSKKKEHPYIKIMATALLSGSKGSEKLSELSKNIVHDKRIETKRLTKIFETASGWYVILPFVPFFVTIIDFLDYNFKSLPAEMIFIRNIIPGISKPIMLIIASIAIIFISIAVKFRKYIK